MKKAFSIIELIVAIVVISIVLMNLPMMLYQSSKLSETSTLSDMLYATESQVYGVLSHRWDENTKDENTLYKVLHTNGSSDLNEFNSTKKRIGHIHAEGRRSFHLLGDINASILGADSGDNDDIDDFNLHTASISASSDIDYISQFDITTNINYISDNANYTSTSVAFTFNNTPSASKTNIKSILVTTKDSRKDTAAELKLRAYSSNIGESAYVRKLW